MTVISLEEFAEKCGKSPRQVRRYIKEGLIQAFRGKHGYTIPLEEMTKLGTSGRPHVRGADYVRANRTPTLPTQNPKR